MTINKLPSIFKQLRPVSIGFDNIFDHFERMFDDNDEFFRTPTASFPFYNIVKTGDTTYDIELALAGYSKDEVSVEYADNLLRITSEKPEESLVVAAAISFVNEIVHEVECPIVVGLEPSSATFIKRLLPLKTVEAIS